MSREFRETVAARVREDPAYVQALLEEAVQLFVGGEPETAESVLRDLVTSRAPQRRR